MRFSLSLLVGAWVLFTFAGCGDIINSLRQESREVDREADRDRQPGEDGANGNADYKPKSLRGLSANNTPEYDAPATRAYGRHLSAVAADAANEESSGEAYHRVTRDDFVDKAAHENSLWDGQGQSNYLFSNNRQRVPGDVVSADVEKELRREIQYQLYMTLPPEQRRSKRKPASAADATTATDAVTGTAAAAAKGADKGVEAKAKDAAEEAAKTNMAPSTDSDLIRMEVVENMGNGMMRVLGQKRVVYRGVSRIVEVAALVNSKDVDDANHTKSSTFLDTKAQVIQ